MGLYPGMKTAIRLGGLRREGSVRPLPVDNLPQYNPCRIDDHVLDLSPLPGIGDVNHVIGGLDHGRIGKFRLWRAFQHKSRLPIQPIPAQRDAEEFPVARSRWMGGVIVDEQLHPIAQCDGIRT